MLWEFLHSAAVAAAASVGVAAAGVHLPTSYGKCLFCNNKFRMWQAGLPAGDSGWSWLSERWLLLQLTCYNRYIQNIMTGEYEGSLVNFFAEWAVSQGICYDRPIGPTNAKYAF